MQRLIVILLYCYIVIFPFGQLGRVAGVLEVHLYLTDIILFLLLCVWGIWRFGLAKKKYHLPSLAWSIFSFSAIGLLSLSLASPLLLNREVLVAGLYWLRWTVYAGLYFVLVDLKSQFKWLNRENLPQHQKAPGLRQGMNGLFGLSVRGFASDTREKSRALARGGSLNFLIGLGVMVAIFGLVQYCLWPNLRPLEELEWDPHYYRVVGTFLDPGFTGIILALTMILIVESFFAKFHLRGVHDPTRRSESGHLGGVFPSGHLAGGIFTYFALALTYSRASYLAYIVGIGVISLVKKLPKLFLGAVLVGILTLIILPRPPGEGGKLSRTYSIQARIKNWQHSLIIAKDHPLLGVGFNAYRYAQRDYGFLDKKEWQQSHSGAGADSSLLFVLATTGILGLAAYLWIWGKAVVGDFHSPPRSQMFRFAPLCHLAGVLRQNRRNRGGRGVIWASLAAVFAHSWFLNSLFYPWVMAWVWILLATESN